MQTFLPYSNLRKTAKCLDSRRLGNQGFRECLTIIQGGWSNHPASRMWRCPDQGSEVGEYLKVYANHMLDEWVNRGKSTTVYFDINHTLLRRQGKPWWLKDQVVLNKITSSHRANLLRKDFIYYSQFGWTEKPYLKTGEPTPYFWPLMRPSFKSPGVYLDD